eukprot:4444575-Amphidinium_carterae.1
MSNRKREYLPNARQSAGAIITQTDYLPQSPRNLSTSTCRLRVPEGSYIWDLLGSMFAFLGVHYLPKWPVWRLAMYTMVGLIRPVRTIYVGTTLPAAFPGQSVCRPMLNTSHV